MTNYLAKIELENRIRLCYFKHRGDIARVAQELSIDLSYTEKICRKIRKRCDRDVKYFVSSNILGQVFLGREQRIAHLVSMIEELSNQHQSFKSQCCNSTVDSTGDDFVCVKCQKSCKVIEVVNRGVHDLLLDIIRELRSEDSSVVDFCKELGFVNPDQEPPVIQKNNLVVIGQNSSTSSLDPNVEKLKDLSPLDRRKLMKSLENHLLLENSEHESVVNNAEIKEKK